jgi:ribonuclease HI
LFSAALPYTAYFEDGTGAIAVVLRNSRGEALAGVAEVFDHASNPAAAKAMASRRGLQLLQDIACSRVIVEADSLEIINACNGVSDVLAPYSAIMADCF